MKKFFFGALALTMFTACSQDEIVDHQQLSSTISFEGAFVENATRAAVDPSFTNGVGDANELKGFDVWAFMDERNGKVFEGEDVTKVKGAKWTYTNTQYWLPNHDYYFGALAPMNSANWSVDTDTEAKLGVGKLSFTNVDGSEDLLYASTSVSTHGKKLSDVFETVKLHFGHLLSKVKFSFTNGFTNANNTLKVTNIKMQVPGAGSINLDSNTWWEDAETATWELDETKTTTLSFGHMQNGDNIAVGATAECDAERLTIPASADQKYLVTFDVALYNGELVAYSRTLSTTIEGAKLRMGYAYNFKAELNSTNIAEEELTPIEFEVEEIKDWIPAENDGEVIETEVASVYDAAELAAAVANGASSIRLMNDIEATEQMLFKSVTKARSTEYVVDSYVLDLNGKDITINPANENIAIKVEKGATLTVVGEGNIFTTKTLLYGVYGTLKIESGVHRALLEVVEANGGKAYINGGEFKTTETYNDLYWTLNLKDNTNAEIAVTGGKFYKFDPSKGKTENPLDNFVAEGYGVEVEGDYFVVKALPVLSINVAAATTETLISNGIINGAAIVAGTLDGANYTLFSAEAPTNNGLIRPEGTATIKNLTIDGGNRRAGEKSLRAFYIGKNGTYNIENVITKGCGYSLNCGGEGAPESAVLNVKNSTFEGWTSYTSSVTATFTGVKFTRGNYFTNADQNGYFRPYGTTVLENCDFALGFIVDFSYLAEGKTITFKNCKYNGVAITADNVPSNWEYYKEKAASVTIQ